MNASAFEKDLKYLWPFLDKLEAHAQTLPGPEAERVIELTRQSRHCFESIVGLLAGDALPPPEEKEAKDEALTPSDTNGEESKESGAGHPLDNHGNAQIERSHQKIAPLTVGTLIKKG